MNKQLMAGLIQHEVTRCSQVKQVRKRREHTCNDVLYILQLGPNCACYAVSVSFVSSLNDFNEDSAEPAPGAVGDNVGRVGDERSVVNVELIRLVSSSVVVRVTDRRQRTVDHALQTKINLEGTRHFIDHLVSSFSIPFPS